MCWIWSFILKLWKNIRSVEQSTLINELNNTCLKSTAIKLKIMLVCKAKYNKCCMKLLYRIENWVIYRRHSHLLRIRNYCGCNLLAPIGFDLKLLYLHWATRIFWTSAHKYHHYIPGFSITNSSFWICLLAWVHLSCIAIVCLSLFIFLLSELQQ